MAPASMDDLVDGGGGYAVLPHQITDADMLNMILAPHLLSLNRGQARPFMNSHIVYSKRMADCKQR